MSKKEIDDWQNFFTSNPELEELDYDYCGYCQNGFIEQLTHLPKRRSLGLSSIRESLHQSPQFQLLLQLTGLTKLTLQSYDNLNGILVDLSKTINLMELEICMDFNDESFQIIKSFRNLEVLSLKEELWKESNEAWILNVEVYPSKLRRLKMKNLTDIPCNKFLEILQHLTSLEYIEYEKCIFEDKSKLFCLNYVL